MSKCFGGDKLHSGLSCKRSWFQCIVGMCIKSITCWEKGICNLFNLGKNHKTFFNQLYISDIRYTDDSTHVTYTSGAVLAVCPSLQITDCKNVVSSCF